MRNEQLYTLIFFFISILVIILLILPHYQSLSFRKQRIAELETDLKNQENYFREIKEVAANLKKYEDSLLKIDSALPSNPSLPELLNFIQKTSAQSELLLLKIGSISTTPLPGSRVKETRIALALTGDYPNFKKFLSVLEKSARLIEVENISFLSPEKGLFEFNLIIKVYSY